VTKNVRNNNNNNNNAQRMQQHKPQKLNKQTHELGKVRIPPLAHSSYTPYALLHDLDLMTFISHSTGFLKVTMCTKNEHRLIVLVAVPKCEPHFLGFHEFPSILHIFPAISLLVAWL
jgi:hypothetical protein